MLSTLWLTAAVWGFPLNRPDPVAIEPYRCRRYPTGDKNNVVLSDQYAVSEQSPGAPVLGGAVAAILVPHATDRDMKRAAGARHTEALSALATLATGGLPSLLACDRSLAAQDDWRIGCKRPKGCSLQAVLGGEPVQADRAGKVGPVLSPIDDPRSALGLLALVETELLLPLSPGELALWTEEAVGYRAVLPTEPWLQVSEHTAGWVLHVPRRARCGCERDVVRRAYFVDRSGQLCELEEPGVPLAVSVDGECGR